MAIKALRVGGSGWVKNNWDHYPWREWDVQDDALYKGSLNLVLQLGYYFHVPTRADGEKQGVAAGVTYFLTPVRLRLASDGRPWLSGFIIRKPDEKAELRHMLEVVAPWVEGLSPDLKDWFELEGPFKLFGKE